MPRLPKRTDSSRRLLHYNLQAIKGRHQPPDVEEDELRAVESPFLIPKRQSIPDKAYGVEVVWCGALTYLWLRLKPLLPLTFLICYSLCGGWIFQALENPERNRGMRQYVSDSERSKNASILGLRDVLSQHFPYNSSFPNLLIDRILESESISLNNSNQTGSVQGQLDFWPSVFYACTVYTTIGFGNIAPVTSKGKVFTIVYAIFGIPLVLYNLSDLGKHFTYVIWKLYSLFKLYIASRLCYHSGGKKYMEARDVEKEIAEIPFLLPVSVTIGWMCGCAGLITTWESDWTYFSSLYYFFQCLTTIGLGDVTQDDESRFMLTFLPVIVGMALVGMCWNMVQAKLDYLVASTSRRIHRIFIMNHDDREALRKLSHESTMKSRIDRLLEDENNILKNFLSEDRRKELIEEWEYQALHRTEKTQTEYAEIDVGVQADPETNTVSTQTGQPTGTEWILQPSSIPYRELVRHKLRASDEVSGLMKDLGILLKDCSDIAKQPNI